ncbi:IPTL-CTERM sorting domain-containing protein [Ottowia thiooxydans]|uniref:IPTL-CTERM protein sorting domain-containing protein n=1 Tax=Ottowia thiooxydans TaxID=219182 RepID=A0ABV2QGZ3_9BURK
MSAVKNVLASVALACAFVSAQAQVNTNLTYSLALTDGQMTGRFYDGQPCDLESGTPDNRFRTMPITVTTAGDYEFVDQRESPTIQDGTLGIYSGVFSSTSLATNCVASVDDGATFTLAAGTYTLVMTSYGGTNGEGGDLPGSFRYTIDGPAAVRLGAQPVTPPPVTAVPTLSEWTLMLLALSAAGLGASRLRRKS